MEKKKTMYEITDDLIELNKLMDDIVDENGEPRDPTEAELAAQKAALEQAIENAKIAINNSSTQAHTTLQQAAATASGELTAVAEAKKLELSALIQTAEESLRGKINEAKSYIDAQLSVASQGLQESINTKVNEAMAIAESKLLAKVNRKFIEHYEKGYFQMPGMPSPLEDTSMHYEGYSWYEANYRGNFFRAKGDNANPFSSKKLTKEQIKNGIYIFQDDEQPDSLKKHKHNVKVYNDGAPDGWEDHGSYDGGKYWNSRYNNGDNSDNMTTWETGDQENRPRNLTFIYWILVKNE